MDIALDERILYEDNHLIVINKLPGEIVQADKTGDVCLIDCVKSYIKRKYNKPGNVFIGLPHRLDRPTSGCVVLCKTSKALERMNRSFRDGNVDKTYYAITDGELQGLSGEASGRLEHYLVRNEKLNKSFAYKDLKSAESAALKRSAFMGKSTETAAKKAVLEWCLAGRSERFFLYEIHLLTGRHHQIRAQLAASGVHIKGDLKYGAARSNPDGGISLHAGKISFPHPVGGGIVTVCAPFPLTDIWHVFGVRL